LNRDVITLKSRREIEKLRRSNVVVAEVLETLKEAIAPGITTMDLEKIAQAEAKKRRVRPAFKGYRGYPYCLCTSVNDEVVHGMPSVRVLEDGDIISVDFGVELDGFFGDAAFTTAVGKAGEIATRLMDTTRESLELAIKAAKVGNPLMAISSAVQTHVESAGFSIVRAFVGHGIGRELHEAPQVPNFVMQGLNVTLAEGMVLAIEPMVNEGTFEIDVLGDGWTAVTRDGKLSAHFEHSVAITTEGPYVLSRL
jgi:methionyl aminopeptidase